MNSIVNFRDLGGYLGAGGRRVRENVILRSGELYRISEEDKKALVEDYRLCKIFDLRREKEVVKAPDDEIPHADYVHLDIFAEFNQPSTSKNDLLKRVGKEDPKGALTELYSEVVKDACARSAYRRMLEQMLETKGGAVLFHCFAGKDRTGMAAALILGILGVSYEDIVADYLMSNEQRRAANELILQEEREKGADEKRLAQVKIMFSVYPDYLDASYRTIIEEYESFDTFLLNGLELTKEQIISLRNYYLE